MIVVAVGPAEHGVVRHGLELADAAGVPVLHFADATELDAALAALPDAIHLSFTDALFGGPAEAPDRIRRLARGRTLWLGLHDVPQEGEGADRLARRRACYAEVAAAADGVVVNSRHEASCLGAAVDPHVIPLPVPTLPTPAVAPTTDIAVFGFLYPGKGVGDVIDAAGAVGRPGLRVVNIGGVSDGHDDLVADLTARARAAGVDFHATGHIPDGELPAHLAAAGVPVVAHRHISASGSLNSWLGAGRRPIAVDGAYVREIAGRWPGHLTVVGRDGLADAIRAALADPGSTRAPGPVAWGWADVARAHLGAWSRLPTIDVVIPHYENHPALHRMLDAIAAQDYPRDLIRVIVADDGSATPPEPRPGVTVVRQEDLGFRAAAARNLGAAAGSGEVLCFLDCDTVPEPGYLAAAVAGHDARTVTVGRRRHRTAAGPLPDPEWLAEGFRATRNLADADDASFRFIISAVLTVGRELFDSVGGFDGTIVGYGGEDWDLGWRLWRAGARFRHAPDAVAWHDGPDWAGRHDDPAVAAGEKNRESLALAARITHPLARPDGIIFDVPDVQVRLHGPESWAPGAVAATVAACLAAGDCRVALDESPFPADPRIGPAVPGARAEVELLAPVRGLPRWAALMDELSAVGRGTIADASGDAVARFATARSRALDEWARRGLADRPRPGVVKRNEWAVLRGPLRLEGFFGGWG